MNADELEYLADESIERTQQLNQSIQDYREEKFKKAYFCDDHKYSGLLEEE